MSKFQTVEGVEFNVEAVRKMTLQQFKDSHRANMIGKDLDKIYKTLVPSPPKKESNGTGKDKKSSRKVIESDKTN